MDFSYTGLVTAIKNKLSLLSNWNYILYFGVYQRIVDLLAYTGDKLVYLAEFLYKESNYSTATKEASMRMHAKSLNYVPYRKTGSVGSLIVSADPTFNPLYTYMGKEILIPKWCEVTDINKSIYTYTTEETHYYTGTESNLVIPIKQGVPKKFNYLAVGGVNEIIYIYSDSVENDVIDVYIVDSNEVVLSTVNIVPNLYFINETTSYNCEVISSQDNGSVQIKFGDGLTSRQLAAGERVLIKYADTLGSNGDIVSTGILTKFQTVLYDEDDAIITLYCNNLEAVTGGRDTESIDSIRNNANNIFQTGMILSASANWQAVLATAPYINKSIFWSAADLGGSTLVTEQNTVYVSAVSTTGEDLTDAQKNDIKLNYILPKRSLTEIVAFEPLEKLFIKFDIIAKINNKTIAITNEDINTILINNYGSLYTGFQQSIYESNFYATLSSLSNIVWCQIDTAYSERGVSFTTSNEILLASYTNMDTTILDKQNYLVSNSFEIWIRRKVAGTWQSILQIARTTGTSISGMNGYTITGNVIYSSNQYSYVISDIANDTGNLIYGLPNPTDTNPLGYVLYIVYKMKDGNGTQINSIRLPKFYQITDIDTNLIDTDISYV